MSNFIVDPHKGERRLIGKSAERWLTRFDIPADQLLAFKAQLLSEPKLPALRSKAFDI